MFHLFLILFSGSLISLNILLISDDSLEKYLQTALSYTDTFLQQYFKYQNYIASICKTSSKIILVFSLGCGFLAIFFFYLIGFFFLSSSASVSFVKENIFGCLFVCVFIFGITSFVFRVFLLNIICLDLGDMFMYRSLTLPAINIWNRHIYNHFGFLGWMQWSSVNIQTTLYGYTDHSVGLSSWGP